MNLKVVFIENITDAFSSLAVLFSGVVILLYGWYVTDIIAALIIACYIIYYGATGLPKAVNILIAAKPEDLNLMGLIKDLEAVEGVHNVHHVHVWQLDEEKAAMEAHVVIENLNNMEQIKIELKKILKDDYCIDHSTLEFERFIEGFKQDKCH
jgi:cobalt-zinc-cadmium efflux system protein